MVEWDEKDHKLYNQLNKKKYTLQDLVSVSQTEWEKGEEEELDKIKTTLPKNVIKLPKDEAMLEPGQNAKPYTYEVKKGDTLKSISKRFCVSYGELSNHLMNTEGNTSIYIGQKIEIPRYFIDLTLA